MSATATTATASRERQFEKLRKLGQQRDAKRREMEDIFQRRRDAVDRQAELMEQLQQLRHELKQRNLQLQGVNTNIDQADQEMTLVNEALFDLDDQITLLEDSLGVDADEVNGASNETQSPPLTMNPDEILPDLTTQSTQAQDILTDPLTQLPSSTAVASTILDLPEGLPRRSSSLLPRPQLVLQPISNQNHHRRISTRPEEATEDRKPHAVHADAVSTTDHIQSTLQQTFGITTFRENQLAIIQATLAQEDIFVIMRTGGGKSLLYQLPVVLERAQHKVTLVISPLLSLMQDQKDQMNQFCPNVCVALHSGQTKSDISAIWRRIRDPDQQVGMLIVTPERIAKSKQLKSELQHLYVCGRLARIVIDECHCCCQWGHDFRPDYAKLGVLRQTFTTVPILAVTATASDRVREDCARILQLRPHYRFFRSTANRPNLTYSIHRKEGPANDTLDDMVHFIQTKYPTSAGIVYTRTRKEADTVAQQLQERGIPAAAYYSDVAPTRKNQIHQSWMRNQTQVVVATIAFGLGINKPDVRFVIHHSMSKTLEAYYQESGRAGRDGNPADCVLYYSPKDVPKMLSMVHGEQSSQLTWTMIKYAQQFGSDAVCRAILLHNLGEADGDMEAVIQAFHASATSRDVLTHSQTVLQLLYAMQDEQVTMPMLVKEWRRSNSSNFECVQKNPPSKDLSVFECEYIIVALLLQQLIATDCQYTAYDLVVYLRCTPRAEQFLTSPKASFTIRLPPAEKKSAKSASSPTDTNGWISTKKTPAKRKRSTSTTTTKSTKKKRSPTSAAAATTAKKKKPPKAKKTSRAKIRSSIVTKTPKEPEVIDIEDDDSTLVDASKALRSVARRVPVVVNSDDLMDDTDEEYEFDG